MAVLLDQAIQEGDGDARLGDGGQQVRRGLGRSGAGDDGGGESERSDHEFIPLLIFLAGPSAAHFPCRRVFRFGSGGLGLFQTLQALCRQVGQRAQAQFREHVEGAGQGLSLIHI